MEVGSETHSDEVLDVRGARCPVPLLRTRKMLQTMRSKQVLAVVTTDPDASRDFEMFCRGEVCVLLSATKRDQEFHFLIRKI